VTRRKKADGSYRMGVKMAQTIVAEAAQRAGLTSGDIIVAFDGKPVAGIDDLHQLLVTERIDAPTTVVVLRKADKLELAIVPDESATRTS